MTTFLVDANLPPDLCLWLQARDNVALAARHLGIKSVTDDAIWNWAVANNAAILTKDGDFPFRRSRLASGPQIIWLRIGNSTKSRLFHWLERDWANVIAALESGAAVIEVR